MNTKNEINQNIKRKRRDLSIDEKKKLIRLFEEDKGKSQRFLATKHRISLGSVNKLLNNSESILNTVNEGDLARKRKVRLRSSSDIDLILYEWFQSQQSLHININGQELKKKALEYALLYNNKEFKASTGWLNSFVSRHTISLNYTVNTPKTTIDTKTIDDNTTIKTVIYNHADKQIAQNDNISQATINNDNSTRVCKVKNEPITPYDAYMCAKKLEKYFITRIPEKLTRVWDIIGDIQEEANSRSINEQNKDEEIDIKLFNLNNCK